MAGLSAHGNVAGLLRARVREAGPQPFVTFYNDATGERAELSHATFENWTAKSANLLVEELDVAPGDRVILALGTHWTQAVLAVACWRVGAVVVPADSTDAEAVEAGAEPAEAALPALAGLVGARVAVVEEHAGEQAEALDRDGVACVVVGGGMAGRLLGTGSPAALPFGEEVLGFGDDHDDADVGPDDPAVLVPPPSSGIGGAIGASVALSQGDLLWGAERLAAWGLGSDGRLLVTRTPQWADRLVLGLTGPLAAGASIVLVRHADPSGFWRHAATERCTLALVGPDTLAALPRPDVNHGLRHLLCPSGAAVDIAHATQARTGVPVQTQL